MIVKKILFIREDFWEVFFQDFNLKKSIIKIIIYIHEYPLQFMPKYDNFCCALIPMLELFKSELVELVTDSFNNRVCKKSSKKSDFWDQIQELSIYLKGLQA